MANTYTQIYLHIVFAVKGRTNLIPQSKKVELYKFRTGIVKARGHKLLCINGMSNHIHILIGYNPEEALSTLVKEIKRSSTNYINKQAWFPGKFYWQEGYGGFSYSRSQRDDVVHYIQKQEEHHRIKGFREEYEEILQKFNVEYDVKYIFTDMD